MHNTQTKKNIPELRFPEFEGEWEEKKLGEVTEINTGKSNVANIENGQYINLGSTGIIGRANKYDYHGQFILIARVGHYAGSLYKFKGKVNISDNTIFIQIRSSKVFLYFQLEQYNLKRLVFGSGQPLIKSSDIKKLKIKLPSINEQQKIGTFFSKLDEQIELAEKKVSLLQEQKKGYMQKIFSQKSRFKDENGNDYPEWEEKKLGDMAELITKGTTPKRQSEDGKINFIKVESISKYSGKFVKVSKISEDEHLHSLKRSILYEGDILFSIAGTIGRTAIVEKSILPANTNQAIAIIRVNAIDNYYLKLFLSGKAIKEFIQKNPTVGAQPNMSLKQVSSLKIQVPLISEQQKIGAFFSKLDQRIELAEQKLEQLKEQKRGLLQKMFV